MLWLIRCIRENLGALFALVYSDLKCNVSATLLGGIWWVLDPLILMAVYYFLIHLVFGRGGDDFHIFVLVGIIFFQLFARSINSSMNALSGNKALICKLTIPVILYVLAPIVVRVFFACVGILVVIAMTGFNLNLYVSTAFVLILLLAFFSFAVGILLSMLNLILRDTSKVVGYIIRMLFFMSPVLYPASRILDAERIPQSVKDLYMLNPLAIIIEWARDLLMEAISIDSYDLITLSLAVLALLQVALLLFRFFSPIIVKAL